MKLSRAVAGVLIILAAWGLGSGAVSREQEGSAGTTTEVIDLNRGGPVADALGTLREKYHLAISYEDPVYACPCDLTDVTSVRDAHVGRTGGPKLIVPQREKLHFEYAELNGRPQEDVTPLLRRMLGEFAAHGGPVFDVRERALPKGTEWNVVPLKARDNSGSFVDQPDILGAPIFIPKARSTQGQFLEGMLQQLRTETGYRVVLGTVETRIDLGTAEFGAENVPARDALASVFGTDMVWDLNYDPENGGRYVLNLVWSTSRILPSLNVYTAPGPSLGPAMAALFAERKAAFSRMGTPSGRMDVQSRLAQAGFYTGELTGEWDEQTVEALKKYQASNGLRVTGKADMGTLGKLGLFPQLPTQ